MFPAASPESAGEVSAAAKPGAPVDTLIALFVVAAYAVVQIILFVAHDPWIDEAQAWLWATSISRPIDLLIVPTEGHPPLWYWILRGLSLVFDFNQARYLSLLIAIANAFLLWRLLGREVLVLLAMLGSFALLQFWGYHFRPYNIVFSCMLGALLLDRSGRGVAATWLMAIACGFHFFSGLLFAFWLAYQANKGTRLLSLLAPALLALVFGALAILSGMGNDAIEPLPPNLLAATLSNLAWVGMIETLRTPWLALPTLAGLVLALHRRPIILATVLTLLIAFALGTAAVYGKFPWHLAFMNMLCFMANMVVGLDGIRRWVLLALLLPQVAFGAAAVAHRLSIPVWGEPDLYQIISTDAGPGFDPLHQLVAWPDLAGVAIAAVEDVTLVSGNNGALLGPINWRHHSLRAIDPALAERPTPYWLICSNACELVLHYLDEHGRKTSFLATKANADNGDFWAYRVDTVR